MYGIFMESVVIFKEYTGLRYIMLLYLAAVVWLLIREKNKTVRWILGVMPVLLLILFFVPHFRKAFVAIGLDGETYYRILWMLPMGITIAYAASSIVKAHKRIGLAVMAALIAVSGTYVYQSQYISKAENLYHLPDVVIEICDFIHGDDSEGQIVAAFPSELVHFVRQYDANIRMPYGRESLVPSWDYYNAVYEAMEKPEVIDTAELAKAAREEYCNFIILPLARATTYPLEDEGFVLLANINDYLIYKDPLVE